MKINKKIIIAVATGLPLMVAAEARYRLSAPIPGLEKVEGATPFFSYLEQLIPFLLGATAVLAVVVITIGGVEYVISGGNETRRSDAKSRIWHAIGGLALAAISWIILNTINPDLVKLRLPLQPIEVGFGVKNSPTARQAKAMIENGTCVGKGTIERNLCGSTAECKPGLFCSLHEGDNPRFKNKFICVDKETATRRGTDYSKIKCP